MHGSKYLLPWSAVVLLAVILPAPPAQAQEPLEPNAKVSIEPVSPSILNLTRKVVDLLIERRLGHVQNSLAAVGISTSHPRVKPHFDRVKSKFAAAEVVDGRDTKLLEAGVVEAALQADLFVAQTNNLDQAVSAMNDRIRALSHIKRMLADSRGDGLPVGTIPVVANPSLPRDELALLPSGAVMIGTGDSAAEMSVGTATLAQLLGLPVATGDPVPAVEDAALDQLAGAALLFNATDVTVPFTVNNQNYSLPPGEFRSFRGPGNRVIRYRGSQSSNVTRYSLPAGTFHFERTPAEVKLHRHSYKLVVDNSRNRQAFRYAIFDAGYTVAAGEKKPHNSPYPMLIRFDRGGTPARRRITGLTANLRVTLNPSDNLWDLYAEENTTLPSSPLNPLSGPVRTGVPVPVPEDLSKADGP